jgi:hypothetical protein
VPKWPSRNFFLTIGLAGEQGQQPLLASRLRVRRDFVNLDLLTTTLVARWGLADISQHIDLKNKHEASRCCQAALQTHLHSLHLASFKLARRMEPAELWPVVEA